MNSEMIVVVPTIASEVCLSLKSFQAKLAAGKAEFLLQFAELILGWPE